MIRIPLWTVQLGLMIASAAIVVAAGWFLLSVFLGSAQYIESIVP